jgi:hypothetical protein
VTIRVQHRTGATDLSRLGRGRGEANAKYTYEPSFSSLPGLFDYC